MVLVEELEGDLQLCRQQTANHSLNHSALYVYTCTKHAQRNVIMAPVTRTHLLTVAGRSQKMIPCRPDYP